MITHLNGGRLEQMYGDAQAAFTRGVKEVLFQCGLPNEPVGIDQSRLSNGMATMVSCDEFETLDVSSGRRIVIAHLVVDVMMRMHGRGLIHENNLKVGTLN